MVQDDRRLTLKDFVRDKREFVALLVVSIGSGLNDDVVDELLDALIVEA